ncbi:hypothetical protein PHYSODRAFT_305001 [Phytophthora sojae]|uniref:WLGC domain-containing protein n=1 Tax=Phytophthora sojae (strain P6497) TaxID=1094619 RepID=G5A3X2_PHYSP|nr:hypothetical protein PHYSODRAFT_305001 [Phytophthora sojae]EGZ09472.1 hypothetical protein PHYSODRAFT_305001 [Phytophthora sojae]|eukprot:XP_009534333.1 hypothetical protein PHYSODRAFT_305001 [Phytophthora sojae]
MPSQVDERTVDGSPESSPMNTTAAAAAAAGGGAQDVIPSLVSQTDGITDEIQEKDPRLTSCRPEKKRSSRPPHLKPRASREPSTDSRPSVVNFVVTEVATFHDVFGILGVPMVIMFLVSAAWTFMLVAIQVHAATIANAVMNTTEFDNGEFWLLPKPETPLVVASAILFTLFGVGYTALAVMIVFFYRAGALKDAETSIDSDPGMNNSSRYSSMQAAIQQKITKQNFVQNMILWARGLPEDVCEHYFGFPNPTIHYYSIMLLCNWFAASYRGQHYVVDPNLIIARLYYTKYDKCALYSYWWNFGEKHCTCLVFADRETTPTTYAEWTSPNDTTANLAELAMAGELRIVQIINRAVPDLPEELTRCHRLEQLILLYTKTIHLPEWLSEFRSLDYFHVEGDFTDRRLQTIPDGMFNHLEHLSFLHLGTLPALKTLPSMASLKNVRYLTLAVLSSFIEIPSFEGLSSVSDLNLIHLPSAPTLPSLAPLKRLTQMVILPPEDKAKLDSFGDTICPPSMPQDMEQAAPCKYSTDVLCGGVLYKECSFNGKQGMCFNSRMMVINCETTPNYIAMRKLQIERGVGKECDPEVEAWLGCPNN